MTVVPQSTDSYASVLAGKRIHILINCNQGGGVEHLADDLTRDFESHGAKVRREWLYDDSEVSTLKKFTGIARAAWRACREIPDAVVSFQPTSSLVATVTGRLLGCKIRVVHQSNLLSESHPVAAFLDRLAGSLGFYTATLVNSKATERTFAAYPRRYRQRIRRIEHGIQWIPPARDRATTLKAYAIPTDGQLLLSCARLVEQKCLHTIIMALQAVPDARLLLAGMGPDKARLSRLATEFGVADRVHFLGSVPRREVFDLCAACDVFVFPSRWETFGLAVVEAAMQGLPVVCTDCLVLREVLSIDGKSPAIYVDGSEPEKWAAAINAALSNTWTRANAEGFAPLVRERYSKQRMLSKYHGLFAELMQ